MSGPALPLTAVARRLADGYHDAPSYRAVYLAVLDGRVPAYQRNRHWFIAERDLATVAQVFGCQPRVAKPRAVSG